MRFSNNYGDSRTLLNAIALTIIPFPYNVHTPWFISRPNDSRMVMALGETYEKLDRLQEAKKCFWKAHSIGDIEGQALVKLAK